MRSLAVEWAPHGILVNSIAPGPIGGTEGIQRLYVDQGREEELISRVALKRLGEKEDIGNAVAYLCSPAGKFVTGADLTVDGARQWNKGTA